MHGKYKERKKKVFSMISQGLVIPLKSFKVDIALFRAHLVLILKVLLLNTYSSFDVTPLHFP